MGTYTFPFPRCFIRRSLINFYILGDVQYNSVVVDTNLISLLLTLIFFIKSVSLEKFKRLLYELICS